MSFMSSSSRAVVLLIFLFISINGQTEHSNLYRDLRLPNESSILQKIASIPLKFYEFKFDSTPGRKQMGFFGAEVFAAFPESVEIKPKFILPNKDRSKPATVLVDYPLIDKSVVFMYSIAAIQELQRLYQEIFITVELCAASEKVAFEVVEKMLMKTDKSNNWMLSEKLTMLKEISLPKKEFVDILIAKTKQSSDQRASQFIYRKSLQDEMHILHHYHTENASLQALTNLESINILKINDLNVLRNLTLLQQHEKNMKDLDFEFAEQVESFESDVSLISSTVKFRIKLQQEFQDEELDYSLMKARDETMRKEIKYVIDTVFLELTLFLSKINVTPVILFYRGGIILLFIIAVMVIYESGKILRHYIKQNMFLSPELCVQSMRKKPTHGMKSKHSEDSMGELVYREEAMHSIERFSSVLRASIRRGLPLPNLLLIGQPGTGKTLTANTLADISGATVITVGGLDLSGGNKVGSVFRSLLDGARKHKNSPVLVIIDEADAIIGARSYNELECETAPASVHCCFFLLLEAIRESTAGMSVIITTSLPLSHIDIALLDRVDTVISLPLPDAQQRAAFIAKRSLHLLSDFINHADKDIVQKYLPLKMINVNGEILHNGDSNEDEEINRHNGSRKNDRQKGNANNDNCNYDGNDNRNSSPVRSSDSTYKVYKMKLEKLQKTNYSEDFSSNHETLPLFDIEYCLLKSVLLSENWSLRYIGKALSNIRSEVLGTESCLMTTDLWMREILHKVAETGVSDR